MRLDDKSDKKVTSPTQYFPSFFLLTDTFIIVYDVRVLLSHGQMRETRRSLFAFLSYFRLSILRHRVGGYFVSFLDNVTSYKLRTKWTMTAALRDDVAGHVMPRAAD